MTKESINRVCRKLDEIREAADEIHPMDIGEHIKDGTLRGWARELRDRIFESVEEIKCEVMEVVEA